MSVPAAQREAFEACEVAIGRHELGRTGFDAGVVFIRANRNLEP